MRRSTRQKASRGVLYALFLAAVVAAIGLADWQSLSTNFFDIEVAKQQFPDILFIAAKNTIFYTVVGFAGGLLLGLLIALMKLSPVAPYRWAATAYVEVFRGLPTIVVIFTVAFAIPIAFQWRPPGGSAGAGLLALIIVSSAYIAETIRAGIVAVPRGQVEAAHSLGLSPLWTMVSVVLPQAARIIVPPLTNELVLIIKDTSLLFAAGMLPAARELTTFARDEVAVNNNSTPLVVAALMYLVVTLPLTRLVAYMERRMTKAR